MLKDSHKSVKYKDFYREIDYLEGLLANMYDWAIPFPILEIIY